MAQHKSTKFRQQQIKRISDVIKRAEAKGYYFGKFKEEYKQFSTQKLKSLSAPKIKTYAEYIPNFTDVVLSNVETMIQEAMNAKWTQYSNNGYYVNERLKDEITTYGRDFVAIACEEAPDEIIVSAQTALMASTDEKCRHDTTALIMLIRSHIPTIEESKAYNAEEWENFEDLDEY